MGMPRVLGRKGLSIGLVRAAAETDAEADGLRPKADSDKGEAANQGPAGEGEVAQLQTAIKP
jgi:hypothetical protein